MGLYKPFTIVRASERHDAEPTLALLEDLSGDRLSDSPEHWTCSSRLFRPSQTIRTLIY